MSETAGKIGTVQTAPAAGSFGSAGVGNMREMPPDAPRSAAGRNSAAGMNGAAGMNAMAAMQPAPSSSAAAGASVPSMLPMPAAPQQPDVTWPDDCEYRQVFRAHGAATPGDTTKHEIAPGAEYHAGFYFRPSWDGREPVQLFKARELIDNRKVIHHWMLYTLEQATLEAGAVRGNPESEFNPDPVLGLQYVLGGVPGATELQLPADVGLRLQSSPELAFSLEIHYLNSGDVPEADGTGVEICVSRKKRPNEAAAHWLGTTEIELPAHARTEVASTCRPSMMAGAANILAVTPHMHRAGVHAKTVINRASGQTTTLHDADYQFSEQRLYPLNPMDAVVHPGDTITVTCSYQNNGQQPISYGVGAADEMCYMTLWAWPAGSIHNNSLLSVLLAVPPDQICM